MQNPQRSFVEPLLDWYEENGRHQLPWREPERSAFEILVAEILLQRTTADAVSGAYVPFISQYGSPEVVAATPVSAIEERIKPLGLVKRGEFIARCSQQLLARHAGSVPRRSAALLKLHGVGKYTARSVLVHAFDRGIAAVDTNARRLVSRFFDFEPRSDAIACLADALSPSESSSDFQHAMLDFAADTCTARAPNCEACPIRDACVTSEVNKNP